MTFPPAPRFFTIQQGFTGALVERFPTPDRWYVGVTANNEAGLVAYFDGSKFFNSVSDDLEEAMAKYHHIRESQS